MVTSIQLPLNSINCYPILKNVQCKWKIWKESYETAPALSKPGRAKSITSSEENAIFPFSLGLLWSLGKLPQLPQLPSLLGPFQQPHWSCTRRDQSAAKVFPTSLSPFHESAQFLGMRVCRLESPDANYFCTKYCNSICKETKALPEEGWERDSLLVHLQR